MTDTITGRAKKGKMYSITCNEASDTSNKDHLWFCLRYVNDDGDIYKDFVKFIFCKSGLTGKGSYNEFTEALNSFVLDFRNSRVLSGHFNGLSALILRENSKDIYTHCASYRLNFVIGTSRKISSVRNLMDVIKDI